MSERQTLNDSNVSAYSPLDCGFFFVFFWVFLSNGIIEVCSTVWLTNYSGIP